MGVSFYVGLWINKLGHDRVDKVRHLCELVTNTDSDRECEM